VDGDYSSQIPKKSNFNMKGIVIISSILVVVLLVVVAVVTNTPPAVNGELSGRYVDSSGYYIEFIGGDRLELFLKEDGLGEPMLTSYYGHYYLEGDTKISIDYTVGMFGFGAYPGIISADKQEISIFGSTFIKQ